MKKLFFAGLMLIYLTCHAQNDSLYSYTTVENNLYTINFQGAKAKLSSFIAQHNIKLSDQNETKYQLTMKFQISSDLYREYDSLITILGYSQTKKISTSNSYNRFSELNLELNYLKKKKDSYQELVKKLGTENTNYLTLWNEMQEIQEKIFKKERELISFGQKNHVYQVDLDLHDEAVAVENNKIAFINMPGVEFSILNIENPKAGLSQKQYYGYFLKYLFTKGKSFVNVGVLKSNKTVDGDTTSYSEMFAFGFGQDFYSRHLGRGSRKFLNLYSGYSVGGILASGKTTKSNMFYLTPTIGLEVFKNKYFLLDTKMGYFIPLSNSRNLRGLMYSAALNFVF